MRAEAMNPDQTIAKWVGREKSAPRNRFPKFWIDDAKPDLSASYLIKGILDSGDVAVVYGPPGSGKTFFTIDLAAHIACGLQWRGKRVHQGPVVYVAAEAGAKIQRRFSAWRENRVGDAKEDRIPLIVITRGTNLLDAIELNALLEELKALAQEAGGLALVVFDTLSRSMPGGKENAPEDMSRVVHAASLIRDELGAATLLVHHTGKDEGNGPRGHSSLHGAVDTEIGVSQCVATLEKSRDGPKGEQYPFDLDVVELGEDEDGDMLTTCIVRHLDIAAVKKAVKLTGAESVCMDAMREALDEFGQNLPGTSAIPAVRGVYVKKWREIFYRKYGDDVERDSAKKAFSRALPNLQKKGLIGISDPWAWQC